MQKIWTAGNNKGMERFAGRKGGSKGWTDTKRGGKGGERKEKMGGLRIYIQKQIPQEKETTVQKKQSLRRAG